ncbi:MAG: hypothetical protein WAN50_03630 [Minisyncoccia bacterium]
MNDRKTYPRGVGINKLSEISVYLAEFRLGIERVEKFTEKLNRFVETEDRMEIAQLVVKMDELYFKYFKKFLERARRSDGF